VRPESVLRRGLLIHPTVMMGRTEWFRANPYDAAYVRAEDRELWVRTCATTKFGRLGEPLFFYREGLGGNLNNYVRTEATEREILRVCGTSMLGTWRTRGLVMRSWLKTLAYRAGTKLGLQGVLIRRRNRTLDAASMLRARAIIADIVRTRVSGLGAEVCEEALA
jgi:hypothetical protein